MSAETLIQLLLDPDRQDVPYHVSRDSRDKGIVVDWRYADARWTDLMRVHGMRGAHRLRPIIEIVRRACRHYRPGITFFRPIGG